MKFIAQNLNTHLYLVMDTTSYTSRSSITTLDEALTTSPINAMSNTHFCHVEDENTILQVMKTHTDWKFIQFVYNEPPPYEFW